MDPVAIRIGNQPIHWYGVMMALGFLMAYFVMAYRAKRTGFYLPYVSDVVITAVVGGLLGSRIYYVISYWDQFKAHCQKIDANPWIRMFYIHEGGLVFLGGFIGAAIAMIIMARWRKLSIPEIADLTAIGIPLGHCFGRIGCFLNGCCFGSTSAAPWAVRYPASYDYIRRTQLEGGILKQSADFCASAHPVQLYSSLTNLMIFLILFFGLSRVVRYKGQLFACFLMLYPIGRFTNEFFRGDHDDKHHHLTSIWERGFTDAQMLAPFILAAGLAVYFIAGKYKPQLVVRELPATPEAEEENVDDDES